MSMRHWTPAVIASSKSSSNSNSKSIGNAVILRRVRGNAPFLDRLIKKPKRPGSPYARRVPGLTPHRCVAAPPPLAALIALFASAFLLFGCETQPTTLAPTGPLPSYEQLAADHNANAALLGKMWSRCTIAMRWQDDEGRSHHQQAEGLFIFRGDRDIALKISKIDAVNLFWFGSNTDRYWLIDEYNTPSTTYVGTHARGQRGLPIQLPVKDFLSLAAVRPIAAQGRVESVDGLLVLIPDHQPIRLYLDPQHQLPVKSEVLDENGRVQATCFLHHFDRLDVPGVNPLKDPLIATRFVITTPGDAGSMTLAIDDMQTSRVSDVQFDLDRLMKAFPTDRLVDLDTSH